MFLWDTLWINAVLVTCEPGEKLIAHGAIASKDGRIAWLGSMDDLPGEPHALASQVHDVQGYCLTPGLIDCHTHLIFAGNRAHEFALRAKGVSYEEIARQGGGIQSTVQATRHASHDELLALAKDRLQQCMAHGVTTIEIKSGYGLDLATEKKILQVAQTLAESQPITIFKTFLGAHVVPAEYQHDADAYVKYLCLEMIPTLAADQLIDAVDVFCEKIAFNIAQTEMIFATAQQFGLGIKCHAEQLSYSGGAELAAAHHALSVDHLEYVSPAGISAMAAAGTVAVLLPGAFYCLRETKMPPVELLRAAQVPMAIATDFNPGTSPVLSLPLVMNMACTLFRFTPEEAWLGVTLHAAKALGMEGEIGSLVVGKRADFAIWGIRHPEELIYYVGANLLRQRVKWGRC